MIISVRGTNGSGKSTVVRGLMERGAAKPIFGVLGPSRPEAYKLLLAFVAEPVFVIGPYVSETGGCDSVHPFKLIIELLNKYSKQGHIVFEGMMISDTYGRIGVLLERWGLQAVFAFLPTPLDECIRRVEQRRINRGNQKPLNPKNTINRYKSVQRVRDKIDKAGIMRTYTLQSATAVEQIHGLLQEAESVVT